MNKLAKVAFWLFIIVIGLPVLGFFVFFVLSTFTDIEAPSQSVASNVGDVWAAKPDSTSPPPDLAAALSFFSEATSVQKQAVKDRWKGKIVEWRLPVWNVSKSGKEYTVQTDGKAGIGIFCRVTTNSEDARMRLEAIMSGQFVTCKGQVTGYTLGNVEVTGLLMP